MSLTASERAFAARVAARLPAGFDPTTIALLLQLLMPIIMNLPCFKNAKRKQKALEANITEAYRDCCKRKKNRIPARANRIMEKHGYDAQEDREALWDAMLAESFADAPNVAKKLIAYDAD
jgi:hypothetical protein